MFYIMRKIGLLGIVLGVAVSLSAAPNKKPQNLQLTTRDGWQISAFYQPADTNQKTVVLLHDLNKNKNAFSALEENLKQAGIGFLALDFRGHGQSQGDVKTFKREGMDNPFNQMVQDVQAAVLFLEKQKIPTEQLVLIGVGLGANVAAKSAVLTDIPALALISPATNIRDVLVIPSMRVYKGDVLLAAAAADKKNFLETSVIRNVAFLTSGEGKVTFLTAYDLSSHEMLDKYLRPTLIQWIKTPHKPDVLPDVPTTLDSTTQTQGINVAPSATEEALVPSVLGRN